MPLYSSNGPAWPVRSPWVADRSWKLEPILKPARLRLSLSPARGMPTLKPSCRPSKRARATSCSFWRTRLPVAPVVPAVARVAAVTPSSAWSVFRKVSAPFPSNSAPSPAPMSILNRVAWPRMPRKKSLRRMTPSPLLKMTPWLAPMCCPMTPASMAPPSRWAIRGRAMSPLRFLTAVKSRYPSRLLKTAVSASTRARPSSPWERAAPPLARSPMS